MADIEIVDLSDPDAEDYPAIAQRAIDRLSDAVRRALGPDWRITVAGMPDRASAVTLADAIDYLATFKAAMETYRRQRDEAHDREAAWRTQASETAAHLDQIERALEQYLRPRAYWRTSDDNPGAMAEPDEDDEPPLGDDLAMEVRRLGKLMYAARGDARSARQGRVSVYVDGQLVHGPDLLPDQDEAGNGEEADRDV